MEKTMTKEEWNELLEAKIAMEIEFLWQSVEGVPGFYKDWKVVFDNCTREEIEARIVDEIKEHTMPYEMCVKEGVTTETFWEWDDTPPIDYTGTVLSDIYQSRFETEEERREREERFWAKLRH